MKSTAVPRIVRLVRPRKSIFSRPISATVVHRELGHRDGLSSPCAGRCSGTFDQRLARDDDAGRVRAGVAGDALEPLRRIDQLLDRGSPS